MWCVNTHFSNGIEKVSQIQEIKKKQRKFALIFIGKTCALRNTLFIVLYNNLKIWTFSVVSLHINYIDSKLKLRSRWAYVYSQDTWLLLDIELCPKASKPMLIDHKWSQNLLLSQTFLNNSTILYSSLKFFFSVKFQQNAGHPFP